MLLRPTYLYDGRLLDVTLCGDFRCEPTSAAAQEKTRAEGRGNK